MPKEDRRNSGCALTDAVRMLNAVQSHTLGEYLSSGADLAFVRQTEQGNIAVCRTADGLVSIDESGHIDRHPDIDIRRD